MILWHWKLDKPARLRFWVFVKLNQNKYKYWDGNAVYSKYVMCDKPSSTLSFQTQAPTLPRFSQMVNIQIQLDSGSRSRYYLRKIKNRGKTPELWYLMLILGHGPTLYDTEVQVQTSIRDLSIQFHFFQDQPKKKREKTWNWGALKILIEGELDQQQLEELVKKTR